MSCPQFFARCTYALKHHVQRDLIVSALWDNNIRLALTRLDELLVHGLYGGQILIHNAFKAPAAITHVAHDPAQYAHVGVCIDIYLDVHKVAQL